MTLEHLIQYKAVAALVMTLVGWPVLSAVLNVMLRRKTPDQWEAWAASRPVAAFAIELIRALGVDPKKAMVAAQRYAQRKAGVLPAVPPPELPPAVAALLADPVKKAVLESLATRMAAVSELPPPETRESLVPPSAEASESRSPEEAPGTPST